MGIAIQIAQLILCLSILVVLHEWGHYITAKIFKMRVEKFYLFFNPYFSLFKKKIRDTEWGLGWLPLGGYVKISGMIDESMDKEQMEKPAEPWEFRSKPAWQRLIVMLGGVTVNAILAVIIFSAILWTTGEQYLYTTDMKGGIYADSLAQAVGFRTGDVILSVDNKDSLKYPSELATSILFGKEITVLRGGEKKDVPIPKLLKKAIISSKGSFPFSPRIEAKIGQIINQPNVYAKDSGLKKGDIIVGVNQNKINDFIELVNIVGKNKNKEIEVSYKRANEELIAKVKVNNEGKIGIVPDASSFEYESKTYGFLESIKKGYKKTVHVLVMQVKQFSLLFDKELEGYKQVGSFISITKMFSPEWNWISFWNLTALLSIWLAFINLVPIPGLDGGHAVFAIYEMISGKKPGTKFMEVVQTIGMVILLTLMAVIIGWDIIKNVFI